ncbi:MAG: hypothetical protein OXQ29_22695 [Rhodospirillaceae bacterium]|nr:hypothetical protein [Rhodospirillaceae bacterium]
MSGGAIKVRMTPLHPGVSICRRGWAVLGAVAVAIMASWVDAGHAGEVWPTPEIASIVELGNGDELVYGMRGKLGLTGHFVGLALTCSTKGGYNVEAMASFLGFPEDRRPLQLAVRGADGAIERFGPVVSAGPESGFHSPRLVEAGEVARFVIAALRPGALVSNGYRSFWNRVSERRNEVVREAFLACVRRSRE